MSLQRNTTKFPSSRAVVIGNLGMIIPRSLFTRSRGYGPGHLTLYIRREVTYLEYLTCTNTKNTQRNYQSHAISGQDICLPVLPCPPVQSWSNKTSVNWVNNGSRLVNLSTPRRKRPTPNSTITNARSCWWYSHISKSSCSCFWIVSFHEVARGFGISELVAFCFSVSVRRHWNRSLFCNYTFNISKFGSITLFLLLFISSFNRVVSFHTFLDLVQSFDHMQEQQCPAEKLIAWSIKKSSICNSSGSRWVPQPAKPSNIENERDIFDVSLLYCVFWSTYKILDSTAYMRIDCQRKEPDRGYLVSNKV